VDLAAWGSITGAVVALGAMCVAIFQANSAKKQADAAKDQAEAARDQASAAWQQVEVAKEQVAEARHANEHAAAERAERRAREAVRWTAEVEPGWERIKVRNTGTYTARNVQVQVGGTDEDWQHRWEREGEREYDFEEVRAGEYFPFSLDDDVYPPEQIYIYWDGAPHPTAVVVDGAPS
jgi:hypothetical protein